MTLQQLADKYGSDKGSNGHQYTQYYDKHLPKECRSLLEIGVYKAASIRMWKEYLPDSKIYGIDLFEEHNIPDIEGVEFFKGNQLDHELLYHIRNDIKPQVCIEDCSHNSIDQIVTFFSLIGSCELFVLEDTHTAKEEFYRQGLPFEATMLGMMKSGNFPFEFDLYDDKIAFIKNKIKC